MIYDRKAYLALLHLSLVVIRNSEDNPTLCNSLAAALEPLPAILRDGWSEEIARHTFLKLKERSQMLDVWDRVEEWLQQGQRRVNERGNHEIQ